MAHERLTAVGLELSISFNIFLILLLKLTLSLSLFIARNAAKPPATPIAGAPRTDKFFIALITIL